MCILGRCACRHAHRPLSLLCGTTSRQLKTNKDEYRGARGGKVAAGVVVARSVFEQGMEVRPLRCRELRSRRHLWLPRLRPRARPPRVLGSFAGNGRRFRHGSLASVRFSAGLFAVGSADLGKRRRWAAFRADSACETAQKFEDGACVR